MTDPPAPRPGAHSSPLQCLGYAGVFSRFLLGSRLGSRRGGLSLRGSRAGSDRLRGGHTTGSKISSSCSLPCLTALITTPPPSKPDQSVVVAEISVIVVLYYRHAIAFCGVGLGR